MFVLKFSVYKFYIPMHDDRRWWSCSEASCNGSDISVADSGDNKSVTVNLVALGLYNRFATGDCPVAGSGVSCYAVTIGVSLSTAIAPAPFPQNLITMVTI